MKTVYQMLPCEVQNALRGFTMETRSFFDLIRKLSTYVHVSVEHREVVNISSNQYYICISNNTRLSAPGTNFAFLRASLSPKKEVK